MNERTISLPPLVDFREEKYRESEKERRACQLIMDTNVFFDDRLRHQLSTPVGPSDSE